MEILYVEDQVCGTFTTCDCDNETYDGDPCPSHESIGCDALYDSPTCAGRDQ